MKPPVFCKSWNDEVKRLYAHDMEEIWDKSILPHVFNNYHSNLERYEAFVPADAVDILDVGCAQGTLALRLAEDGYNVTALDIRREFLDYAKSRWTEGKISFIEGNVFDLDIQKRFDLVFANQIIEHLVYPSEFVDKLYSLLKPNGMLIISTPNFHYIKNNLPSYTQLGDPKQWEHTQFTADGDGHFFAYTKAELLSIFNRSKLRNVKCLHYETPWISGHIKFRFLHNLLPYKVLKNLDRITLKLPFAVALSHQLLVYGYK